MLHGRTRFANPDRVGRLMLGWPHPLQQDTALGFEALGGLPGPYIKYFMKAVGHEGKRIVLSLPRQRPART